jgi:hypothetical protein
MRPKIQLNLVLTVGLTLLGLVGFAAARPDDPPPPAAPTVLLLTNGRIIQGEISREGNEVLVKQRAGVIRRPKDQVEGIFRSLNEAYEFKRGQLPELDPDEHLKLARWCLSQNLQDSAKKEVLTVLKVSPRSGEAKAMLVSIEAAESRQHQAPTFDPGLIRTGAEMPEPDQVAPAVLKSAKVQLGISDAPVIFNLPASMAVQRAAQFKAFVHPVLQASCVKCHNENSDRAFRLIEERNPKRVSGDVLRANLDAVLQIIDPENLPKSEILAVSLVPHGNGSPKRPIFTGSNDRRFQILAQWVTSLQAKDSPLGAAAAKRPMPKDRDREPAGGAGFATERNSVPSFTPTPPSTGQTDPGQDLGNISVEKKSLPPSRFVPGVGFVAESSPPAEGEFPVPFAVTGTKPGVMNPAARPGGEAASAPPVRLPGGAVPLPKVPAESLPTLPAAGQAEGDDTAPSKPAPAASKPKKPIKINRDLLEKALRNRNAGAAQVPGN